MTKPVALAYFGNLVLGNQLETRLESLGYHVSVAPDASLLPERAEKETPLLIIVEVPPDSAALVNSISSIRALPNTRHIPILAYAGSNATRGLAAAREAGANMVASDKNIVPQLPFLLDQVLQID